MVVKKEEIKMNKFEETRILSARALELAEGDKPKVKLAKGSAKLTKDYVKIAEQELKEGKLELEIYRAK